ncbi:MAG: 4-hydroxy-3-methylbut-2-enyl diphosphate reductase [Bacteroidota bacterium]|jgi:4-hydroxy-3-methylbut-2-enyl diphosphate reductase
MKSFDIPEFYRSPVISKIKQFRKIQDPRKKDLSPVFLDFGPVGFYISRHFGFCYGVENAIEISFKAIDENPGKNIFLLSQMIHNPEVNKDLISRGVQFLQDTEGNEIIPLSDLKQDDIVIIPAFGTTVSIENKLIEKGIEIVKYNTTCPFVERVWKKSEQLGDGNYTVIIHGKYRHEETRATFSRSAKHSKAIVIKDIHEAEKLGAYFKGEKKYNEFFEEFKGKYSEGFNPETDLTRVGVINQTTMLATETAEIADYFKKLAAEKYGQENLKSHFADTRDTLCYATNENQDATLALRESEADFAVVVGGYNSSNTSHLVELLETKFPTYFICGSDELISSESIQHFNYPKQKLEQTSGYVPVKNKVKIILTSGASCPDSIVESVMRKLISFFENTRNDEEVLKEVLSQ